MKKLLTLAVIGLSLSLVSCKKDDDPTKKEMLTGKNWKLTGWTIDPALPVIGSNFYNQLNACFKDDLTKFSTDGKITFDEGATKCQVSDPQTTTGTWALSTDEKTVSITSDGETTSYTIVSLSSSKFVGTFVAVEDGVNYTNTLTWEKQ